MCLDSRTLRSVSAHKGWETRRARAAELERFGADSPVEGGSTTAEPKASPDEQLTLPIELVAPWFANRPEWA
jgi:hypothetical protein